MRWALLRLLLLRVIPGRLLPILTVVELFRLAQKVRRMRRRAR